MEDPGGGVEKGHGEDDVLQAVDDGEDGVLSPDSPPLGAVVIPPMVRPLVPVSQNLRNQYRGQNTQQHYQASLNVHTLLQIA